MTSRTLLATSVFRALAAITVSATLVSPAIAVDHREAPIIGIDSKADLTDVYAFKTATGQDRLAIATHFGDFSSGFNTQFNFFTASQVLTPLLANPIPINNPSTTSDFFEPRVVVDPLTGNITTTFVEFPNAAPPNTFRRVFDPNGNPLTSPLQLNTSGTISPRPSAIVTPFSNFAGNNDILYIDPEIDPNTFNTDFVIRRFDSTGNTVGTPTPVGVMGAFSSEPRVAAAGTHNGALVAAAGNNISGTSQFDLVIARVGVDITFSNVLVDTPVPVNNTPALFPDSIDLTGPNNPQNGDAYYVVWDERDLFGRPVSMLNRIIVTDTGISAGTPVKLGNNLINAENPKVAVNKDGTVMVTYQAQNPFSSAPDTNIFAQHFAPNGTPIGGVFQVNSFATGNQTNPDVDDLPSNGAFFVAFSTDNTTLSPSGDPIIAGIDLPAPMNVTPNTVIANDFGTPSTNLRVTGATATHNGGPTNSNNFADIVADPDAGDTSNGVLHFKFAAGKVTYNSGFPSGRRQLDDQDVKDLAARVISGVLTGRIRADQNAITNGSQLFTNIEFFDNADPNNPVLLGSTADIFLPLPGSFNTWESFGFSLPGDQLIPDPSIFTSITTSNRFNDLQFSYSFFAKAPGDPEIWLDDFRIDFVPIPEPATLALIVSALPLLTARRRCGSVVQTPVKIS